PQTRYDSTSFSRELDRVREQVPDSLLQTAGVAEDHAVWDVDLFAQNNPFRFDAGPDDIDGGMKNVFDLDRLGVELESSGDDPRGVEDVLDQQVLRFRALRYHLQRVARLLSVQPALDEHAGPAQDCSQRRAQFVRDGGQEFVFHPVRGFGVRARGFFQPQQAFEFLFDLLALCDLHHNHIDAEHPAAAVLDWVETGDEMAEDVGLGSRRHALFDIQ